ncbi:MAG TPA: protein kinase [Candidatus Cloacimonadota bacterium]|nr:protein kinase [Candidatus Cloacimonadota bacterium]
MASADQSKIRDFTILTKVLEDSWGELYVAEDSVLQRKIYIRKLSAKLNSDDEFINHLFEEVNRQAEIQNPNIMSLQSFFSEQNQYYLVTDYFESTTLRQLLDSELKIKEQKALLIISQILNALVEAHKYGLYHFALNPRCIFISKTDMVKVSQFGYGALLEKRLSLLDHQNDALYYQSPEQVLSLENIDGRSDLYSLGVIMYEMLTGQKPYHAKAENSFLLMKEITEATITDAIILQPDLSQTTLTVMNGLLIKDREKRIGSALDCRQILFSHTSEGMDITSLSMKSSTELFVKAKESFQAQKHDEAAMIFKLILEKEPENALAFYYLGMISLEKSHFIEAQEFLTKALVLQPWNDKVLYYLGLLNYKQERYLAAEDYFQKAIKANSELSRIYYDGKPYQEKPKEVAKTVTSSNTFYPQKEKSQHSSNTLIWVVVVLAVILVGYAFWHHIQDKNDMFFPTDQGIPQNVTDSLKQEQMQQSEQQVYTLDDAIATVKDGYLDNYSSMKIIDSVNNVLTNTEWSASSESSNTFYVKVMGNLLDSENHELIEITYLFVNQKTGKVITIQSVLVNKVPQNADQIGSFLSRMYQ